MSYNKQDLIGYRLEKARQSLAEANAMADVKYWDTVSNRLYYACFYAITAYLAQTGIRAITHKGIKSAFVQTHSVTVNKNKIKEYRVNLKISFEVK